MGGYNMKIFCKNTQIPMSANQQVKQIGKYLYKNIDGAFNSKSGPNMFDIWFTLLYQLPRLQRIPGKGKEYNDVHKMTVNINITTYQNKIRVNTIEVTPQARTLGFDLFTSEQITNLADAKELILDKIRRRIHKAYIEYDILF